VCLRKLFHGGTVKERARMRHKKNIQKSLTKTFMKSATLSLCLMTSAPSLGYANDNPPVPPETVSQEQPHMIIIRKGDSKAEISWSQPDKKNWHKLFDGNLTATFNLADHKTQYQTPFVQHWKDARDREKILGSQNHTPKAMKNFHKFLDQIKGKNKIQQLRDINKHVNNTILYTDDQDLYQAYDYFASAFETSLNQKGDCEDYTLMKFYALEYLGFDMKETRLAILDAYKIPSSTPGKYEFQGHATLMVNTLQGVFMLDNRFTEIYQEHLSSEYQILYTMNDQNLWVYDTAQQNLRIQNRKNPPVPKK